ncbi:glycosyl hydrolase family 28 protein [Arenibacter sp. F26102]|uniref:glycoside hydrolase family 28 protein n=1 Tax=Arenibacter sp. F26102 TaxID=2926416 RepID=UPI001FF4AB3B|nr:glycosyl hydrolase family 28 protein [Arenibacter sp. F26102]MCK0146013.1 glycosyl hydrolase family 28 protein [Arenibacter sp. F26102]
MKIGKFFIMNVSSVLKNKMSSVSRSILLGVFCLLGTINTYGREINILTKGAISDSLTLNTHIIQSAIDELTLEGGGTVIVPAGKFSTGPLHLKDNVELHLKTGAFLYGSTDAKLYQRGSSWRAWALINARGQKNVSVTGNGTINGLGDAEVWQRGDNAGGRPNIIYFLECENVLVDGITMINAALAVSDFQSCNYVRINGVKIYSFGNHNNDGIDIDSSNVVVSNCIIETEDDALCFKSNRANLPSENITVTNCVLASNCNGIKFGTTSRTGFKNISVTNCVIKRPTEDNFRHWDKNIEGVDSEKTVISGLALEVVDGGVMDQILISDIIMDGVQTPIFIKLGDRKRPDGTPGQLKNIQINNIIAKNASLISSSITGYPGNNIQNVKISNVDITYKGGGTEKQYQRVVPENEKDYPENRMFGHSLPAYGFFIRHVENITLQSIQMRTVAEDIRPAFWLDDVSGGEFSDIQLLNTGTSVAGFVMSDSEGILVKNSLYNSQSDSFVKMKGGKLCGITILNNVLLQSKSIFSENRPESKNWFEQGNVFLKQ